MTNKPPAAKELPNLSPVLEKLKSMSVKLKKLDNAEMNLQVLTKSAKQQVARLEEMNQLLFNYSEGYQKGYSDGYTDGIKYLVKATEEEMAREMKLASRDELVQGKLPAFWIICLARNLNYLIPEKLPPHLRSMPLKKTLEYEPQGKIKSEPTDEELKLDETELQGTTDKEGQKT